jgi:hypothetical protein
MTLDEAQKKWRACLLRFGWDIPMMKVKTPYSGNAITDGQKSGGWFVGDRQLLGSLRYHKHVFIKYGLHHTGETCKEPYKELDKINFSILVGGGPFVHSFKRLDDDILILPHPVELKKIGDYVIYGTDVKHTWTALKTSTVLTVQFPPSWTDTFRKLCLRIRRLLLAARRKNPGAKR